MKIKKIAILSLSLIYSMNVFSIEKTITEGDFISPENTYLNDSPINSISLSSSPMKNEITRPILDEFVSDLYIHHVNVYHHNPSDNSEKTVEIIRITDEIIRKMDNEIKKIIPKENFDIEKTLITDNQFNDKSIDLDNTSGDFKEAVLGYLANFSSHTDTPILIPNSNEPVSFNKNKIDNLANTENKILIQRHYRFPDSKLDELEKNILRGKGVSTPKETVLKLEDHFVKKITAIQNKQEEQYQEISRKDSMLDNKIDHAMNKLKIHIDDTNENKDTIKDTIDNRNNINKNRSKILSIEHMSNTNAENSNTNKTNIKTNKDNININKNKIDENADAIDESRITIIKNTNNITENTLQINDIKENTINGVDINGVRLPLKNHLSHLYNQQSTGRSQFNALKENFEHFKSDTQNRFYKVEKRANQGIASVAAMSNLPFTDNATFSTAIGIGNYRNATALAWGMQYRINENIKVRASTAWNESNSWVSAGGVGISW